MSDLPREVIAFPDRKTQASKRRVDAMAKSAIVYLDKAQREQDEQQEKERYRKAIENDLRLVCKKAYVLFGEEADALLMNMLPFVQTAVKLQK